MATVESAAALSAKLEQTLSRSFVVTTNIASTVENTVKRASVALSSIVTSFFARIGTAIESVASIVMPVVRRIRTEAYQALQAIVSGIIAPIKLIGGGIKWVLDFAAEQATSVFKASIRAGQGLLTAAGASLGAGVNIAKTFLPVVIPAIAALGYTVAGAVAFAAKQLSNSVILGFKVGGTVLNSILLPAWGVIKNTIAGAFKIGRGAYNFVVPILQTIVTTVSGWIKHVFTVVADFATQTVPTVLSSVTRTVSLFVSKVISFAPSLITSFATVATRAINFGAALFTLVGTIGLVTIAAGALTGVVKSATDFARSATQLSAFNGSSVGSNANLINRLSIFGIGTGTVQSAFSNNTGIANLKAGIFGLPSTQSSGFIEAFARKFASLSAQGLIGQLQAANMAKIMGLEHPEILALTSLTPAQRTGQSAYASSINSSLGLNPEYIVRTATAVSLSVNRISFALDALKMKLFSIAGPAIERGLSVAANLIGTNANRIGNLLEGAIKWLFVAAPSIVTKSLFTVTQGIQNTVNWALSTGHYLASSAPIFLSSITNGIANVLISVASTIDNFAQSVGNGIIYLGDISKYWSRQLREYGPQVVESIADTVSRIGKTIADWGGTLGRWVIDFATNSENGFRMAIRSILVGVDSLVNGLSGLSGTFAGIASGTMEAVKAAVLATPALGVLLTPLIGLPDFTAPRRASEAARNQTPTSHLASLLDKNINGNAPDYVRLGNSIITATQSAQRRFDEIAASTRHYGDRSIVNITRTLDNYADKSPSIASNLTSTVRSSFTSPMFNAASVVEPLGRDTGTQISEQILRGTALLSDKILPPVQSLASAAQALNSAVDTRRQLESPIAELLKEQNNLTRELIGAVAKGSLPPGASRDAIAKMLAEVVNKQIRAIL